MNQFEKLIFFSGKNYLVKESMCQCCYSLYLEDRSNGALRFKTGELFHWLLKIKITKQKGRAILVLTSISDEN